MDSASPALVYHDVLHRFFRASSENPTTERNPTTHDAESNNSRAKRRMAGSGDAVSKIHHYNLQCGPDLGRPFPSRDHGIVRPSVGSPWRKVHPQSELRTALRRRRTPFATIATKRARTLHFRLDVSPSQEGELRVQ
jgi:hypothetical protein